MARPTKLDTMRRERVFVQVLLNTGSVDQAVRESKVHPSRVGVLLDRPDVRSVLLHADTLAA